MYRYHALGGASLLVLGGALSACAVGRRGPDVVAGGDRRGAARHSGQTCGPQAGRSLVRPDAGAAAVGQPRASASLTAGITPSVARALLYQAPTGQTETTIDRSQFDNRPAFSVADVLRESPGISVKQGNGPRDIGISIRGSNARNGFGIRNLVIFDDGFPVTQPDGLSRSDLIDPQAPMARSTSSADRRRRSMATMPPAARSISAPARAAPSTASNTASRAAASAISTTTSPPARRSAISSTRCLRAMRAVTGLSTIAGSTPRR